MNIKKQLQPPKNYFANQTAPAEIIE